MLDHKDEIDVNSDLPETLTEDNGDVINDTDEIDLEVDGPLVEIDAEPTESNKFTQNEFSERDLDATRIYLSEIRFSPLLR